MTSLHVIEETTVIGRYQPSARDLAEAGPSEERRKAIHKCTFCGYVSNRNFNVVRHSKRIHEPMKKPRICCGIIHSSKYLYYHHCEVVHPKRRSRTKISKYKYCLVGDNIENNSFDIVVGTIQSCRRSDRLKKIFTKNIVHVTCTTSHDKSTNTDSTNQFSDNVISQEEIGLRNSHSNEAEIQIDFTRVNNLDDFTKLHYNYLRYIDFDSFPRLE